MKLGRMEIEIRLNRVFFCSCSSSCLHEYNLLILKIEFLQTSPLFEIPLLDPTKMLNSRLIRTFSTSRASSLAVPAKSPVGSVNLSDREASAKSIWQGTRTDGGNTPNLIGGEWTIGEDVTKFIDINDPSTQRVLTRVPETSLKSMTKIVDKAEEAFFEWRETSVLRRQGVMLK